MKLLRLMIFLAGLSCLLPAQAEERPARVTVIFDAFGKPSDLERGWGYSALVEYGGKRILFDAGGQYQAFADNVRKLKIDLKTLDFVVISHRHGDHTGGLAYVLEQNPHVKIYAPLETGSFGTPPSPPAAKALLRNAAGITPDLRYFNGQPPANLTIDSPWPGTKFTLIDKSVEIAPGLFLVKTVSDSKGTLELNELSLAIRTPQGLAVIVGCSHPGIERILEAASQYDRQLYTVVGGLHLVDKSDQQVSEVVSNFKTRWHIERIAAGHCTGEFAQVELERVYGDHHDHSGIGEVIALPR
ncbi:MBL fold metallo-hydrolase [Pseudoduganella sp. FT25W]|uniref:MBL fold metallo-hydrolase n=1 Tax=Duganella alba TaxID=2666081 RepID=A0A6L5QD09_9BURK|nr:MBL fold metallo-hydrolase [Duganella alba]MRX07664.1 MBL fold metallo-hydrolase [Duganella alba]MRX16048.1 MBL fold metallo-hydrolase [Duganella alba]